MDIYLAGEMTGIEAAEVIRSRLDIPVIFLTAYSDSEIIEEVRKTGPYGYLLKPFNEQEMYITIEVALFRHSMDRALRESEQRYRLFVEHFQGVAFRLSMDLEPVFYHGALSLITGYTEAEIKAGKPPGDTLVHPMIVACIKGRCRRQDSYRLHQRIHSDHTQAGGDPLIQAFIQNVVDQGKRLLHQGPL
jgi:CheY-like chemotaxis protein